MELVTVAAWTPLQGHRWRMIETPSSRMQTVPSSSRGTGFLRFRPVAQDQLLKALMAEDYGFMGKV